MAMRPSVKLSYCFMTRHSFTLTHSNFYSGISCDIAQPLRYFAFTSIMYEVGLVGSYKDPISLLLARALRTLA